MACNNDGAKKSVWIFKVPSEDNCDKYKSYLESHNHLVFLIPTLEFQNVNLDILWSKLSSPNSYSGLVFTSTRSAIAFEKCIELNISAWNNDLYDQWHKKQVFVVGPSTRDEVSKRLKFVSSGEESENSNELSQYIIQNLDIREKSILFPAANLKSETMINQLTDHGINVDSITVYNTCPHEKLEETIKSISKSLPDFIIYFSPSGVKFTLPILKNLNIDLESLKFIAIGPTTSKCLKENGICVHSVASSVTPEGVFCALNKT